MDNRSAILESALELFYERGYDAVGVQEIVERAGVTKPTLYYYFGSKRGLLENLIRVNYQRLEERIRDVLQNQSTLPERLYRVARTYFDCATANPRFLLLMLALLYSGRKNEGFQVVYPFVQRYYELAVNIFETASGELGNMNGRQRQFAVGFMGILDYHLTTVLRDREDFTKLSISDEQTYAIVHQFMYGIYS